ncbi:MAG TPA: thiamine-phosphate kinase [Candidatus Angelobacter sp.]|nr:thiamine-phosphate kinase [Candidatus Angelobacter sp.]
MTKEGLTEREILRVLKRRFDSEPRLPLGFEDDVAAFPLSQRTQIVLKTDMLVGSTDVPPGMTVGQAAMKAVVATVSDFAAKGVQPKGLLISLGLAPPVKLSTVNEIVSGLKKSARHYHCRIIGGDTSETDGLVIDCIGFGFAQTGRILRRDGAKPGDIVAVTGDFGRTAAGLRLLLGKKRPWPRRFSKIISSVLYPSAKLETGLKLAQTGFVDSSIDSSDGLAWSLYEIARLSRVNIVLEKIPVASDVKMFSMEQGLVPEELALFGGEEYELVLAIKRDQFTKLRRRLPSLQKIGNVTTGSGTVIANFGGRSGKVEPRGYEHFSQNNMFWA